MNFDFEKAQNYEIGSAKRDMLRDFESVYKQWEKCKSEKGLWQDSHNQWFDGDEKEWQRFIKRIKKRKCLEIGSGPFGFLSPCYWLLDRVIIDPLVNEYRGFQLENFGKTLFTEDITLYNNKAEDLISELINQVDGCVVCRNALDHCKDPLVVLDNISKYAKRGCYFLLWTDIWHIKAIDEGHRNISQSTEDIDNFLMNRDFAIIKYGRKIRNPENHIEYGRILLKR